MSYCWQPDVLYCKYYVCLSIMCMRDTAQKRILNHSRYEEEMKGADLDGDQLLWLH